MNASTEHPNCARGLVRWCWLVALLALALAYYGSYLHYGIGFRDEGQTVALDAQRLLAGEVPLHDVVLNYNVMWFFPVVALFKFFGVSYVLLRGWCFALSTLTAVLGFLLVEKTTRRPWLAFIVAAIMVLIPGSQFKNYIPLLAVANSLCLLHVALTREDSPAALVKSAIAGLVLGLSFLIRIDIALLFAALWFALLGLRIVLAAAPFFRRTLVSLGCMVVLAGTVAAVHWPVWIDAQRRGYARELTAEYLEKWRMLERPIEGLIRHQHRALSAPAHAGVHRQTPRLAALNGEETEEPEADKQTLHRVTFTDWKAKGENAGPAFVALCYAPLLIVGVFILWTLFTLFRGLRRDDGEELRRALAALVVLGGALTTFPQFFFFRPDVPHLSEFMPGFLAAIGAASGLMWTGVTSWKNWRTSFAIFLVAFAAVYVARTLPDRWAGTIAIRKNRSKLFTAENGVHVYVSKGELAGLTEIQRQLRTFAPDPHDYVVCYPYSPGINVLADRPTYERNVYIDNVTRTTHWDAEAIARFEKYRPAAIVLSDWNVNGTKASRFSVWAVKTKTWIQTHYTHQGTYKVSSDAFEIYTREPAPVAQ